MLSGGLPVVRPRSHQDVASGLGAAPAGIATLVAWVAGSKASESDAEGREDDVAYAVGYLTLGAGLVALVLGVGGVLLAHTWAPRVGALGIAGGFSLGSLWYAGVMIRNRSARPMAKTSPAVASRAHVIGFVVVLAALAALVAPTAALAERPNIDRVTVSRDGNDRLRFSIFFAKPVIVDPEDQIQVAIDADRDRGTGVDGLDYSLDQAGPLTGADQAMLLTAVDGEPVTSRPPELRFSHEAAGYGFSASSVTFTVPASLIGDPRRFDFYVFIRVEGELDEAPSHVLFSAGSAPWTYPKDGEPDAGAAYPADVYVDGSDFTLSERGWLLLVVVGGVVLGVGAILGVSGWSVQRLRERRRSRSAPGSHAGQ